MNVQVSYQTPDDEVSQPWASYKSQPVRGLQKEIGARHGTLIISEQYAVCGSSSLAHVVMQRGHEVPGPSGGHQRPS